MDRREAFRKRLSNAKFCPDCDNWCRDEIPRLSHDSSEMMTRYLLSLCTASALVFAAGSPLLAEDGQKPFRLPGGDYEDGRTAFMTLNCNQCHTVAEVVIDEPKGKRRLDLRLASEQRFVKSYKDIITAITNPQHVINEQYRSILNKPELNGSIKPFMPDLTREMSARQLMDLVAFLDKVYAGSLEGYGE